MNKYNVFLLVVRFVFMVMCLLLGVAMVMRAHEYIGGMMILFALISPFCGALDLGAK